MEVERDGTKPSALMDDSIEVLREIAEDRCTVFRRTRDIDQPLN
ncbi:MAG TPA: hypothetical protein VN700_02825 [Vicinamibacterales bacterium]|nr:hypothetical protein [Vicinamibacterales bacterium]